MTYLDNYYRAYREFQDKIVPLKDHEVRMDAMREADPGTDMHNGSASIRIIDMEWVEAIEKAIAPIDQVIRENRRFIRTDEEIVPIEKSRRITTESVRHLAQHTNMIARVDGDQVTPESILNIRHEESFAIYENRFVVLLIDTAIRFVESRFQALTGSSEFCLAHICMNREFTTGSEHTRFSLDYFSEYEEPGDFDIHADISSLSDFERVVRLRTILSSFAATPLIRGLKGVEPVRPPITRTNLLMKNPAYRACLDLWVFLETYSKSGYETVQNEVRGELESDIKEDLESAMDLVHFIVRSRSSPKMTEALSQTYEAEKERELAEAARAEEEREERVQKRIRTAVEDGCKALEEEKNQLVEEHKKEVDTIREDNEKHIAEMTAEHEQEVQGMRTEHEQEVQTVCSGYEEKLQTLVDEHQHQVQTLRSAFDTAMNRVKKRFEDAEDAHQKEKQRMTEEHSAALAAEITKFGKAQADYEDERSRTAAEHAGQVRAMQEQFRRETEELEQSYADRQKELQREHTELLAEKESGWLETRQELEHSVSAEHERLTAMQQIEAADRKEIDSLRRQLEIEKKKNEQRKESYDKAVARMQEKLARAEEGYRAKLERQEKQARRKTEQLEKRLKKALKKCPYAEVMAPDAEMAAK